MVFWPCFVSDPLHRINVTIWAWPGVVLTKLNWTITAVHMFCLFLCKSWYIFFLDTDFTIWSSSKKELLPVHERLNRTFCETLKVKTRWHTNEATVSVTRWLFLTVYFHLPPWDGSAGGSGVDRYSRLPERRGDWGLQTPSDSRADKQWGWGNLALW